MQEITTGFSSIDFAGITTAISSQVTPADVISLMAVVIGAGMVFTLTWFGGRLIVNKVMGAIKSGRLRF